MIPGNRSTTEENAPASPLEEIFTKFGKSESDWPQYLATIAPNSGKRVVEVSVQPVCIK